MLQLQRWDSIEPRSTDTAHGVKKDPEPDYILRLQNLVHQSPVIALLVIDAFGEVIVGVHQVASSVHSQDGHSASQEQPRIQRSLSPVRQRATEGHRREGSTEAPGPQRQHVGLALLPPGTGRAALSPRQHGVDLVPLTAPGALRADADLRLHRPHALLDASPHSCGTCKEEKGCEGRRTGGERGRPCGALRGSGGAWGGPDPLAPQRPPLPRHRHNPARGVPPQAPVPALGPWNTPKAPLPRSPSPPRLTCRYGRRRPLRRAPPRLPLGPSWAPGRIWAAHSGRGPAARLRLRACAQSAGAAAEGTRQPARGEGGPPPHQPLAAGISIGRTRRQLQPAGLAIGRALTGSPCGSSGGAAGLRGGRPFPFLRFYWTEAVPIKPFPRAHWPAATRRADGCGGGEDAGARSGGGGGGRGGGGECGCGASPQALPLPRPLSTRRAGSPRPVSAQRPPSLPLSLPVPAAGPLRLGPQWGTEPPGGGRRPLAASPQEPLRAPSPEAASPWGVLWPPRGDLGKGVRFWGPAVKLAFV